MAQQCQPSLEFLAQNSRDPRWRIEPGPDPEADFFPKRCTHKLEAIVHPLIQKEIARQVALSTADCLVFDIPLLVESPHWRQQLDRIWVVDCTEVTQISRVQQRNGWDRAAVQAVIVGQAPRAHRMAASDAVIFNNDLSPPELTELVKKLAATFGL